MHEYMERDEWRFLLADFRAAAWCIECPLDQVDGETLLRKFLSLHQFFLRNIGRERPDLFAGVPDAFMIEIVRRWVLLYRQTLTALRTRYPRTRGSQDLKLGGVNWSEALGINYEGLLTGRESFIALRRVLGREVAQVARDLRVVRRAPPLSSTPPDYWRMFELANAKQLIVVDQLVNAIPWFDLVRVSAGAQRRRRDSPPLRRASLARRRPSRRMPSRRYSRHASPEAAANQVSGSHLPSAAFSGCPHFAR